ncbi:MAG: hypothetical protein RLZZ342_298 [Candidatus Parcubacteria bacterium]
MKTMTCAQMGGMCETPVQGASAEEIMQKGMVHLEEAHPEMAATVKAMPKDDPAMVAWNEKFAADYAALPEDN